MQEDIQLARFDSEQLDTSIRQKLIALENEIWPAFHTLDYPEENATFLCAFLLIKEDTILAHAAIHTTTLFHKGVSYPLFGIKEVMVAPRFQGKGYGKYLLQKVFSYLELQGRGLSILTCHKTLVHFYEQTGWCYMPALCLVGGTKQHPFRSDEQGVCVMLGLHGDDAKKRQFDFVSGDIVLELGEHKLW